VGLTQAVEAGGRRAHLHCSTTVRWPEVPPALIMRVCLSIRCTTGNDAGARRVKAAEPTAGATRRSAARRGRASTIGGWSREAGRRGRRRRSVDKNRMDCYFLFLAVNSRNCGRRAQPAGLAQPSSAALPPPQPATLPQRPPFAPITPADIHDELLPVRLR
jgi:hypothetical protein